jgi:hypothetical protein
VSLAQVLAGALASVSAAVVASYFGIAGTLLGAATTSVVIIIGGALYQRTLERTHGQLVRRWRDPQTGAVTRAEVTKAAPARGRIRWGAVGGGLAAVLGLTFGAVTAVELLAQQPLAAMVQQEPPPAGPTTLGVAVRQVTSDVTSPASAPTAAPTRPAVGTARPTPEVEPTPAAAPTPSATGTAERTPTPTPRTAVPTTVPPPVTPLVPPSPAASAIPTTPGPTAAPATAAPTTGPPPPAAAVTPRPGTPVPP